jgi:cell division protein FtsN
MPRDYKHRSRNSRQTTPGWQWLVAGLTIGLTLALGVYLYDRRPGGVAEMHAERPVPTKTVHEERDEPDTPPPPKSKFDFYDELPKFEVVIPEQERDVRTDAAPAPVNEPGTYVLQAGSFRNMADADRTKATLAMQGVESRIQQVTIDEDTWHRVRIGPFDDLAQLEQMRRKLRDKHINVIVIRLVDEG